jgi:zinc transport system permease protein
MEFVSSFTAALTNPNVPFIRYALIAGLLSSAAFGMVGSIVVVRRISYVAGAISHAALAGLGASLYFNEVHSVQWLTPMLGATIVAVGSAWIIALVTLCAAEREDTIIGAIWAVGMAVGLIFIAKTPGYVDAMSYLFGNILLVGRTELWTIGTLSLVTVSIVIIFFPQIQSFCFDELFAKTRGVPTAFFTLLLYTVSAITVVLLMVQTIGIVMVIAMLTLPAAAAGLIARRLQTMMILGIMFCALANTIGLAVSYHLNVPTGPTTIILSGILYITTLLIRSVAHHLRRVR